VTGSSWSAIIVGDSNLTCGIRNDSTVYCWGYNAEGRLGDPNYSAYLTPVSAQ
jgi:alpha-tubulin suppressor-like RCC1 family protein